MAIACQFSCTRLNDDTFVVIEDDKYGEHPFIYVKIYNEPSLIVISDTGCGGDSDAVEPSHRNLCDFLETCDIPENGNKPLNPRDADRKPRKKYLVICTHCHYDHILGLPSLVHTSPTILASSYKKSFVTEKLSEHSICDYVHVDTPDYHITYWADDFEKLSFDGKSLDLQILHTPGHTPDELAWYDGVARQLYVGDSFYERVAKDDSYEQAIIFPKEGNLKDYMASLEKLIRFVDEKNAEPNKAPIKVGCGHVTSTAAAKEILVAVKGFFSDVLNGKVPTISTAEKGGEQYSLWKADGNPRFSLEAPVRLLEEAREAT